MPMRNDELIEKLSKLRLEENCLKRNLDINYLDEEIRTKIFKRIKENKNEIELVKFKIRLEKEMKKNANNNTYYPKK